MKSRTAKELRELFVSFWEEKGSKHLPSFSLVPEDPSLLFTIAGMVPLKPYYLGIKNPEYPRVVTSQKCVRTNDIENVGRTARHHTFFEMLGNFTWGSYFKNEAISWAWEFLTERVGLDPARLYATIYLDDEEAFAAWRKFLPAEKIYRFGQDDNYWFMETPDLAGHAVRSITTGAKSTLAENPRAESAVIATGTWRSGIWYLRSSTDRRTEVCRYCLTRISIPEWD